MIIGGSRSEIFFVQHHAGRLPRSNESRNEGQNGIEYRNGEKWMYCTGGWKKVMRVRKGDESKKFEQQSMQQCKKSTCTKHFWSCIDLVPANDKRRGDVQDANQTFFESACFGPSCS